MIQPRCEWGISRTSIGSGSSTLRLLVPRKLLGVCDECLERTLPITFTVAIFLLLQAQAQSVIPDLGFVKF